MINASPIMRALSPNLPDAVQQTGTTAYGSAGSIATAGFLFGGAQKTFSYAYLPGTHLLQTLTKPAPFSASCASPCGGDRRDCPRYGLFFPNFEGKPSFYLYIQ